MKPMIIPIFIMNKGCPNRCIFCNVEKTAGGKAMPITASGLRETVIAYTGHAKRKAGCVVLAFYGGNFTGLNRNEEIALLGYAKSLMDEGLIHSIRVSTRPDYISGDQCDLLRSFGVTTVEIGVQSLDDHVLLLSRRGHTAKEAARGVDLLKKSGFITGVHLMVGLPGDNPARFAHTIDRCMEMRPHMVRLHPTIVFEKTELAEAYRAGHYVPLSLSEAVEICKYALKRFKAAGIPVIRLGLQTTSHMEAAGSIVAGPFHPAFHALVEESIFYDRAYDLLSQYPVAGKEIALSVSPRDESYMRGQKNGNLRKLKEQFHVRDIAVKPDKESARGTLVVQVDGRLQVMGSLQDG